MNMNQTFYMPIEKEYCVVGSDGGIEGEPIANNHPRGAGCFSRAIYKMKKKGYKLEFILSKVTNIPASLIPGKDMKKRGKLQVGAIADITVFDFEKIRDISTIQNPNGFSKGIEYVLIGGKLAFKKGKIIGYYGKLIKRK